MPLLPFLATFAMRAFAPADDAATFAKNDRAIGSRAFDKPSPLVKENLDILVKAVNRARNVEETVSRFDKLAKANDDGFATSFSWAAGSRMTVGDFTAVCVSYGPIGRVAIFERDTPVPTAFTLYYMVRRKPAILSFEGYTLIIASTFVRDAGMRDNTKVDVVRLGLGRLVRADNVRVIESLEVEHTLDWGGATIQNNLLTLESLDAPKSFIVPSVTALFKHKRVYRIDGDVVLVEDQLQDLALRAVDDWLYKAQRTNRPDKEQRIARQVFPRQEMLEDYKASNREVVLKGDRGMLRFTLKEGCVVSSVASK